MSFAFITLVLLVLRLVTLSIQEEDGPILFSLDDAPQLFEKFIMEYKRTYKDKNDRDFHYEQFKNNLAKVNEINEKYYPKHYDLNEFADYSKQDAHKWLSNTDW